jgi:thymidylate synthase (FAD)
MREVFPEVFLVARPQIDWDGIRGYLESVDDANDTFTSATGWAEKPSLSPSDGEVLVEFGGRLCYRSWAPQLNPNVTRVRENSADYLANILASAHGSVLEHANFSFVLANVSRVLTHELVRHRAGTAISQESLRFVRLNDIPMWMPAWAKEDERLMERVQLLVDHMEGFQDFAAERFGLDEEGVPFSEKKAKTSWMRRLAPDGLGTSLLWTANVRTLRWVVEARTAPHAEEEIRLVFHQVAEIAQKELPSLFGDFVHVPVENSTIPAWAPVNRKV